MGEILAATIEAYSILQEAKKLSEAMPLVLKKLGEANSAERTYIFKNLYDGDGTFGISYQFEWCRNPERTSLGREELNFLPWRLFPDVAIRLQNNEPVSIPLVELEDNIFSGPFSESENTWVTLFPIISKNKFWGFMGLNHHSQSDLPSESQTAVLYSFAQSIGHLLMGLRNYRRVLRSEKKHSRIIENIRDVAFKLDYGYHFVYLNPGWEKISGYTALESTGASIVDFVENAYHDFLKSELERMVQGEVAEFSLDLPFITQNAQLKWVKINIRKLKSSAENELFGTITDIHQSKLTADKLMENQSAFTSLFNTVEDVLYIGDPKGKNFVMVSDKVNRLGLCRKGFLYNSSYWLNIVHPDDRLLVDRHRDDFWNLGSFSLDYRVNNEHGITLWVNHKTWMEYDTSGQPLRVHGRYSNITSVKTKEIQLLESEERFKTISESLPFPLIMCTMDELDVLYINEFFLNIISQSTSSVSADFDIDDFVFHPDPAISVKDYIRNTVEIDNLEVLVKEVGGDSWYSLSSQKIPYHGGFVLTIVLYNIHKRKLAELERMRLAEILQALDQTQLNFSTEVEVQETFTNLLTTLIFFTRSEYGFLGEVLYDGQGNPYLKSNAISNSISNDHVHQFIQTHAPKGFEFRKLNNLIGEVLMSGKYLISNNVTRDERKSKDAMPHGHPELKRFLGIPIYKGDKFIGLVGLANKEKPYTQEDIDFLQPFLSSYANLISLVNVNKQKVKAESMQKESENLYKILSDNVDDIVSLHDLNLKTRYVSPSIERVAGFHPDILVGKDFFQFVDFPLDRSINFENYPRFVIPVRHKRLQKTIKIEMIWKPLYDENNRLYSYLATSRDVTERESILLKLKATLDKEKELNQLKSRFISMTSHELRTPLATILSSTDLLAMIIDKLGDNEIKHKSSNHIRKITGQLGRLTQIISDVLLMQQNSDGRINIDLSILDLNKVIMETLLDNFGSEAEGLAIKLDLPVEPVLIRSDLKWLSYIVRNIVENALKYSTGSERVPELTLRKKRSLIYITVQDFGIGVPEKEQKYIFDPFYRSSNVNGIKGTGIGLSIVYELVLKLGGHIDFRSKENKGTTITVSFPYERKNTSGRRRSGAAAKL